MKSVVGLVAKKVGMSRVVDAYGHFVAVTLLVIEKQAITKVLTMEKNGYCGYQVGYFQKAEKNLNRPDIFRLRKAGIETLYSKFCEFRLPLEKVGEQGEQINDEITVGKTLDAADLEGVSFLNVSSHTKGRGFQGSVKRWNFRIAAMSHGSKYHRRTGSLGNCTTPGRVMPGKKLPGHYGDERRTLKNLEVIDLDKEKNLVAVKGGVPGNRGTTVELHIPVDALTQSSGK